MLVVGVGITREPLRAEAEGELVIEVGTAAIVVLKTMVPDV